MEEPSRVERMDVIETVEINPHIRTKQEMTEMIISLLDGPLRPLLEVAVTSLIENSEVVVPSMDDGLPDLSFLENMLNECLANALFAAHEAIEQRIDRDWELRSMELPN